MNRFNCILVCCLSLGMAGVALASPIWITHPQSVYALYDFPTNSKQPAPTASINPFGAPTATITLGAFAEEESWQDFNDPNKVIGAPGHGTWQLGQAGTIDILLPIAPQNTTPSFARLEIEVDYYINLGGPPQLTVDGIPYQPDTDLFAFTYTTPTGFTDIWYTRTWSILHLNPANAQLQVTLTSDALTGSIVDRIEMYAIPEPDVFLLMGVGVLLLYARMRRTNPLPGKGWAV